MSGRASGIPQPRRRRRGGASGGRKEAVRVMCRFRPINDIERSRGQRHPMRLAFDDAATTVTINSKPFTLDRCFAPDTRQETVYEFAGKPIVADFLEGYNGTIFAYGQTGSGKTHTMFGDDEGGNEGIIPRSVHDIFGVLSDKATVVEVTLKLGFLEIYQERLRDLLNPQNSVLKIRETPSGEVFVEGLHEEYVASAEDVMRLIEIGEGQRSTSFTNMNAVSSRSHSVLILSLTQKLTDGSTCTSKLNLADLAGSERVKKTGAKGDLLAEAQSINQSLSALGNVINALTDSKRSHTPFRDSKLTYLLKDSLGGNTKTSLIVTCSPHGFNAEETVSTLQFAKRAKTVTNRVCINKQLSVEELTNRLAQLTTLMDTKDARIRQLESAATAASKTTSGAEEEAKAAAVRYEEDPKEKKKREDEVRRLKARIAELEGQVADLQDRLAVGDPTSDLDGDDEDLLFTDADLGIEKPSDQLNKVREELQTVEDELHAVHDRLDEQTVQLADARASAERARVAVGLVEEQLMRALHVNSEFSALCATQLVELATRRRKGRKGGGFRSGSESESESDDEDDDDYHEDDDGSDPSHCIECVMPRFRSTRYCLDHLCVRVPDLHARPPSPPPPLPPLAGEEPAVAVKEEEKEEEDASAAAPLVSPTSGKTYAELEALVQELRQQNQDLQKRVSVAQETWDAHVDLVVKNKEFLTRLEGASARGPKFVRPVSTIPSETKTNTRASRIFSTLSSAFREQGANQERLQMLRSGQQRVIGEGYVFKKAKWLAQWRKRYIVLRAITVTDKGVESTRAWIDNYEDKASATKGDEPRGSMVLEPESVSRLTTFEMKKKKKKLVQGFELVLSSTTVRMYSDGTELKSLTNVDWVQAINAQIKRLREEKVGEEEKEQ